MSEVYYIIAVSYQKNPRQVEYVQLVTSNDLKSKFYFLRHEVINKLNSGAKFYTGKIENEIINGWPREKIKVGAMIFQKNGFITTVADDVKWDNLGELPEL